MRAERASMVAVAAEFVAAKGGRWGAGRTTIGSQRHKFGIPRAVHRPQGNWRSHFCGWMGEYGTATNSART